MRLDLAILVCQPFNPSPNPSNCNILGPTSNSDFFHHISSSVSRAVQSGPPYSTVSATHNIDVGYISRPRSPLALQLDKHRPLGGIDAMDCFALPPQPKIVQLVDIFFSGMGLLFPYIHQKSVLDSISEIDKIQPVEIKRTRLCLLNTIMAFATCVTGKSDERRPNCAAEADLFLQRALKLIPDITMIPATLGACTCSSTLTQSKLLLIRNLLSSGSDLTNPVLARHSTFSSDMESASVVNAGWLPNWCSLLSWGN